MSIRSPTGFRGALLGIIVGCLPGLSATLCIALLTTLTIKMAPNDAILILICSYVGTLYGGSRTAILLNIPGTAANAASCADGHALALARRSRPRHRHRDIGRVQRHAVWRAVPGGIHAAARRSLAVVRGLRVLLARAARRRDVRQHRRQRSAQGLADGHARPVRGADRPGRPLRPRSLHVRMEPALRRHFADPGAGRRVRFCRSPDHAGRSGRAENGRDARLRAAAVSRGRFNTGAPCCVRASSAC